MRIWTAMALAILLAGCGPSQQEPGNTHADGKPAGRANRPPRIQAVDIFPSDPTPDQTITLALDVQDPDRDELEIEVDWLRNGELIQRGPATTLPASELVRGDEVRAVVTVRDAESEVSLESASVYLRNRAPRMLSLDLLPKSPTGADNLMAVARAVDPEEDEIRFEYRWYRNDEVIPGMAGAVVPAAAVRRGHRIRVEVRPLDDDSAGSWTASPDVPIRNAAPLITSKPSYDVSTPGLYHYDIEASDPDDDGPLRFELVEGPPGMNVDLVTGEVRWPVPPTASGDYTIEVAVSDPFGGSAHQRYSIDLRWDDPPAAPVPPPASQGDEDDYLDESAPPIPDQP